MIRLTLGDGLSIISFIVVKIFLTKLNVSSLAQMYTECNEMTQ